MDTKVYDYKPELVRDKLVGAFKERKREATTADLIAVTGLPKSQVEAELPAVADEYGARLRVTESGEILYSFPEGMKSRYHGFGAGFKRFWKSFKKIAAKVGTVAFKVWIVVMLVGYFLFFVALALLAMLASVAVSVGGGSRDGHDDRRGGGLGGLWLVSNLVDSFVRLWFYSELFKSPGQREYERDQRYERRFGEGRAKRPLYTAIFSFVFGDGDPNASWDEVEKKAVVAFLQGNKGIMTLYEFMAITGLSPVEAESRINRYLLEFEGEPEVSEDGSIYYRFKNLLRRKDKSDGTVGGTVPMKRVAVFSVNTPKMNKGFCLFNGVNLLFGSYFATQALAAHPLLQVIGAAENASKILMTGGFDGFYLFTYQLFGKFGGAADPAALLGWVLGAVPLVFSVLFYAIPAIRSQRLAAGNEAARLDNMRRVAYRVAVEKPEGLKPEAVDSLASASDATKPKAEGAAGKILVELAAASEGEPAADGSYSFPAIKRTEAAAAKERLAVKDSDFDIGATVFDSHL